MKIEDWLCEELDSLDEEASDDEILDSMIRVIQDEFLDCDPVYCVEEGSVIISRLGIINTLLSSWMPGYKIVVELDSKTKKLKSIYLDERHSKEQ